MIILDPARHSISMYRLKVHAYHSNRIAAFDLNSNRNIRFKSFDNLNFSNDSNYSNYVNYSNESNYYNYSFEYTVINNISKHSNIWNNLKLSKYSYSSVDLYPIPSNRIIWIQFSIKDGNMNHLKQVWIISSKECWRKKTWKNSFFWNWIQ